MTAHPLALPCIIEPCSAFTRALRSFDDPSLSSIALGYQTVEEIAEHRARGGTILLSQLTTIFSCYFNTHLDNTFGQFVDLMWSPDLTAMYNPEKIGGKSNTPKGS